MRQRRIPCLHFLKNNALALYKSGKWRKSPPQCTIKMVQKCAKICKTGETNRFSLQQLPPKGHFREEKAISLRKCTKKKSPSAKKKSKKKIAPTALYRWDPPPGAIEFLSSALLPLYLSLGRPCGHFLPKKIRFWGVFGVYLAVFCPYLSQNRPL